MKWLSRYVTLILGSLLLMSCANTIPQSTPTTAPAPTALPLSPTSQPAFVPGVYTKTIVKADVPSADLEGNIGDWRLKFNKKDESTGSYTVDLTVGGDNIVIANGGYTIKGDQISFNDNSEVCLGKGAGTYHWVQDGKQLTLELITDNCEPRKLVQTTHPFVLQQ